MGCATSKRYASLREESRALRAKIHGLEEEIREARSERDREACARGRREAALAAKQGDWKRERRRHRKEVRALEKRLAEEEESRRALEEGYCASAAVGGGDGEEREQQRVGVWRLVEQMKAEQARREQAAEKWKQLYLAIKAELDALILRTKQGEKLCWVAEENATERLHRELKAKEETIEALRSRLEATEVEGNKRDMEVDILRQSLRILSSNKRNRGRKCLVGSLQSRAGRQALQHAQVTCASFRV